MCGSRTRGDRQGNGMRAVIERTPIGDQHVIPGAERDPAGLARKLAAERLRPSVPQEACNVGLFSDDAKQTELPL